MFVRLSFLSILFATVALAQPTGPPTGPANCATAKTLACLAGRTTTGNDFTMSTSGTQGGSIKGSTVAGAPLNLNSGVSNQTGPVILNTLRDTYINTTQAYAAPLLFDFHDITVTANGAANVGTQVIQIGRDIDTSGALTTDQNTFLGNGAEYYTNGLADNRVFTKTASAGGYTGSTPATGQSDMDEYSLVHAFTTFRADNGNNMNFRKIRTFLDASVWIPTGTGTFNYVEDLSSFWAEPNIPRFVHPPGSGNGYVGVHIGPIVGTGSGGIPVVGVDVNYDSNASSTIAYKTNTGSINAGDRAISSTGTGPSVHVGTFRIGDTAVATEKLEVKGNIKIDNTTTTPGELRLDIPSGDLYTAFKTQTQAGSITYTLPAAAPTADGYVLASTTTGTMSWDDSADNATCASTTLLCRAGRAGTANDFTISTTVDGTITGSTTAEKSLILNGAAHDTAVASGYRVRIHPADFGNIGNMGLSGRTSVLGVGGAATFDNSLSSLQDIEAVGTWTVSANIASDLLSGGRGVVSRFGVTSSGTRTDIGTWMGFVSTNDIRAGASSTVTTGQSWAYTDHTTIGLNNLASGALNGWTHVTVLSSPFTGDGAGATAIDSRVGFDYEALTLNGTAYANSTGVYIAPDTATNNYSLVSDGTTTQMIHVGPAIFGTNAPMTNASTGLELNSTTKAILLSRMTNAQRTTLTGVAVANGMELYNTTTESFNAYRNGQWVDATPWNIVITKTADETVTNSAVYQDDDELFFTVANGEAWIVDLVGGFGCSDATGDGKMTFTASSALFDTAQSNSTVFSSYNGSGALTAVGATAFFSISEAQNGGLVMCNGGTATTIWPFHIEYRFRATAAGTVKVQFANNNANTGRTTTLKAGAQLKARRISAI